ncbi:MAG: protein translocase subunit SecF [Spirochaetaceae bacterium]|nr:protein translocase subunit SecF [Spirochaetaceae bacterium]
MKRVIPFTNLRAQMAVLSAALIVAGIVATMLRGGVNLSVDLSGGVAQQFQVAPVALAISDGGAGLEPELTPPDPLLGRAGFLTVQWAQEGTARRRVLDFDEFSTIGAIADELRTIPGVEVELAAPPATPAEQLQAPGFREAGQTLVLGYLDPGAPGEAPIEAVRAAFEPIRTSLQATGAPGEQRYIVRTDLVVDEAGEPDQQATEARIFELLAAAFGADRITIQQTDFVGPSFSRLLGEQAVWLITVAFALIFVYILFRFRAAFAVGALLALIHDIAIMLGVLGTLQLEISTATIAAVLTIVGYSLNDTIVIFDRIRENDTLMRDAAPELVINTSITQSLSRTLITSVTTLVAVLAIYLFSTSSIKTFALSLMIGVVVGTYSSMFVAAPTVLIWRRIQARRSRPVAQPSAPAAAGAVAQPAPAGAAAAGASSGATAAVPPGSVSVVRTQRRKQTRRRRRG